MYSQLFLNALKLDLYLGWLEEERAQKQSVFVDIQLRFPKPPLACISDNLIDTFCYDSLIQLIKKQTETKPFRLLEHLAHELYQVVKNQLPETVFIGIRVTKQPAIENLTGGASFCFGDEECTWSS